MQLKALYAMVALTGVGFGIANPLVPLLLARTEASAAQVGLAATALFVAMAGAALGWGPVVDRLGPKPGLVGGAAVFTAALLLLPAAGSFAQFLIIRTVEGAAVGVLTVSLEAAINLLVTESRRGRALGTYTLVFAAGVAAGPTLSAALGGSIRLSFVLAAVACAGAGLLILLTFRNVMPGRGSAAMTYEDLLGRVWSPVVAVACYALVEVTMLSLFPLYLAYHGLATPQVTLLFALYASGAIISPPIVGALSDRIRREWVMVGCGAVLTAGTALLWSVGTGLGLIAGTALMGVAAGGIYPTGLSLLGDRLPPQRLGAGNSLYTAAYSVGSIIGPFSMGLVMDRYGAGLLLAPLIGIAAAFTLLATLDVAGRGRRLGAAVDLG